MNFPVTRPDRATIEGWLAAKIAEVLEARPGTVDVEAPFTSYGLESLDALTIAGDLAEWLNRELSATLLWEQPTIRALAAHLAEAAEGAWQSLTPIQPHGARLPLFCVHGIDGSVLFYGGLAHHLGTEQPFYGFRAAIEGGGQPLHHTIAEMAASYVGEMRAFQAQGPYLLCGLSFGGIVAFEMARQLQQAGHEVGLVALLDSACPGHAPRMSLGLRLLLHSRKLGRLRSRQKIGYLAARMRGRLGALRSRGAQTMWRLADARKLGPAIPGAFERLRSTNENAGRAYLAPHYAGRVTLFRAVDRLGAATDLHRGLNHVADSVEVHDVPGDHFSLISEPHVAVLAARLAACLERAQRNAS